MSYPGIPRGLSSWADLYRIITDVVNGILLGRTNNYGSVTLTASAASTTVSLAEGRLSSNSKVYFEPLTASAAAEYHSGNMYVTAANHDVANRQFIITHSNHASTDRDFGYVIVG